LIACGKRPEVRMDDGGVAGAESDWLSAPAEGVGRDRGPAGGETSPS
jgi:hypothetical protein